MASGHPSSHTCIPALPCCHVHLRGQKPLPSAYPTELHTVGDHLRKRRLDLRLLQREAAGQIGVDTATITNWELGQTTPALCWMPNVIQFLGYDPEPEPETVGQSLKCYRQLRDCLSANWPIVWASTRARWAGGSGEAANRWGSTWQR